MIGASNAKPPLHPNQEAGPAQTCSSIRVSPNSGWTRPLSVLFYFVPHSQAGSTRVDQERERES